MNTRLIFSVLLSITYTLIFANIEGRWINQRLGLEITIEETSSGIKVVRSDKDEWFFYQRRANNSYRDQRGNIYSQQGNNLLFTSAKGRSISFERAIGSSSHQPRSYGNDNYNAQGYCPAPNVNARLQGTWVNQSTGQKIDIDERRRGIMVRAKLFDRRSYFRSKGSGLFIDDRGNSYTMTNRGLTYESFNGDFSMRFIRY